MTKITSLLTMIGLSLSLCAQDTGSLGLIPKPAKIELEEGYHRTRQWTIACQNFQQLPMAEFLQAELKGAARISSNTDGDIQLEIDPDLPGTSPERYTLEIDSDDITITAAQESGLLRGSQTLAQLVFASQEREEGLPCLTIEDAPRYPFRSMHLDVSRHFYPASFIKRYIDILAYYKINFFHWHLTDDNGWRLEIKKYPKLTSIGAWRVDYPDIPWTKRPVPKPHEKATYGGFYTQEEIKEVVAYAATKGITVIPEIEMPAHSLEVLASYPEFACKPGPYYVATGAYWPNKDILCAGNEKTYTFLEDVLTEVLALFPSPYIHIGGDEADKTNWKTCPKCQAKMKALGLKDEGQLQAHFMARIAKFLTDRGRKSLVWDEVSEEGVIKDVVVMSWRDHQGGINAAKRGLPVVMTPEHFCYFNHVQNENNFDSTFLSGFVPLRKTFQFDPLPEGAPASLAPFIQGGGACLWTEYVESASEAEFRILPRLAAISESLWSPRLGTATNSDFNDFGARLQHHYRYYKEKDYRYTPDSLRVNFSGKLLNDQVQVSMACEAYGAEIHYSLDGTDPKNSALVFDRPLTFAQSCNVKAAAKNPGGEWGKVFTEPVQLHKAFTCPIQYRQPYHPKFPSIGDLALLDGLSCDGPFTEGRWQGFEGNDLDVEITMKKPQEISNLAIGFLTDINNWIFPPLAVSLEYSKDGQTFTPVLSQEAKFEAKVDLERREQFRATFAPVTAAKIRVRVKNTSVCPDWHPGKGGKTWLFVDEIVVQ